MRLLMLVTGTVAHMGDMGELMRDANRAVALTAAAVAALSLAGAYAGWRVMRRVRR